MVELFKAPNPVPVKTALQMKGLDVGTVRFHLYLLQRMKELELSKRLL